MEDLAQQLNSLDEGRFASFIGLEVDSALPERVVGHVDLQPHHMQPYGIVHGGVYASIVETLASLGAAMSAIPEGKNAAGVENHTSFLRSIGGGRVTAVATAIQRGRTMHLWEVAITDDQDRLVARGTV
ncbi:MAG: 1,4-dihydroxy-2-naphthoyl-CoA hydrolase, partial [Chloroflexota bacterium]|nr:1,4-dihydroxy-2-naphthoyl-CoA hydrolase [Chloroflexota bacterium]